MFKLLLNMCIIHTSNLNNNTFCEYVLNTLDIFNKTGIIYLIDDIYYKHILCALKTH